MKDWRETIRKNLGANVEKYIFSHAGIEGDNIVFYEKQPYEAASKYKAEIEKYLPGKKLLLREFS